MHAIGLRPLHRGDHHVVRHRAAAAEDAVRPECDTGRDAGRMARLPTAVGADDACDVRTVTVAVIGHGVRVGHRVEVGALGIRVVGVSDEIPLRDDS